MRKPVKPGLTHFCYTIWLSFFTYFDKKRVMFLQLDLRRNATRCMLIIANSAENFKYFFA